ncbi:MAG TPA: hypothetical protein VKK61_10745, partial [Tepidisphaeraceae bacterium]|nr:hypothetical protein [Tepidisphaeraceae bacterium]
LADFGDSLGRHFQCIDYSGADSRCPQMSFIQTARRGRAAAEKPFDLGSGRSDSAVYRHQVD